MNSSMFASTRVPPSTGLNVIIASNGAFFEVPFDPGPIRRLMSRRIGRG